MRLKGKIVRIISLILLIGGIAIDFYDCYSLRPDQFDGDDFIFHEQISSNQLPYEGSAQRSESEIEEKGESSKDGFDFIHAERLIIQHGHLDNKLFDSLQERLFHFSPVIIFIKNRQIII